MWESAGIYVSNVPSSSVKGKKKVVISSFDDKEEEETTTREEEAQREEEEPILNTHPIIEKGEIYEKIIEEVTRVVEMVETKVLQRPLAFEVALHLLIGTIPPFSGHVSSMPTEPLAEVLASEEQMALALVKGTTLKSSIPEGSLHMPDVGASTPQVICISSMLLVKI